MSLCQAYIRNGHPEIKVRILTDLPPQYTNTRKQIILISLKSVHFVRECIRFCLCLHLFISLILMGSNCTETDKLKADFQ
jgi:hypothetical protein